jgi:NAD(P)H-flavin reductase
MPSFQEFTSQVTEKKYLNDKVILLRLKLVNPSEINFKAGQFITIIFEPNLRRSYSIFSFPSQKNELELLIDISVGGQGSEYVKNLKINQELKFLGPLGNFQLRSNPETKTIYFVATGSGVAPMHAMIADALSAAETFPDKQIILLWGISTKNDAVLWAEFGKFMEKYKNFKFIPCVSREEVEGAFHGRVTDYLNSVGNGQDSSLQIIQNCQFYICGNREMVNEVSKILTDKNALPTQIITERY